MTHTEIIRRWGRISLLADEIGCNYQTVRSWKNRGHIPPRYWPALIASAEKRGIEGVTLERLAKMSVLRGAKVAE